MDDAARWILKNPDLSLSCVMWFVLEWIKTEFMPEHYFKQTNDIIQLGTRWFYQSQSYLQQKISGNTCAERLSCEFVNGNAAN